MQQKPLRPKAERVSLAEFVSGTDENNLAEFPLALLSDSAPPNQKTIEFQDTLKDWKNGQEITRRVCVTGSDKYGLPTAKDEEVLAALLQLTRVVNNFSSPEVPFSKHQVIELLGWENSGWAYNRVEESLHRWKGVSVHYWNAWRDHTSGTWTDTEAIGIIDYFKISDGRRTQSPEKREAQSRFVWNRELFKSFQAGYLKPLDFGLYRSLKRPAAKRALRFLSKRFFHRPEWEFDLQTFACEKLGFSRKYDTGQLKARLHPAMVELEQAGFINPVSYRKVRRKTWNVLVSANCSKNELPKKQHDESPKLLVEQLVTRGIAKSSAKKLVQEFPTERIEEKLRYFDWLTSRKDKRVSANAPGFLVAAIRNDYALPKDFWKSQSKKPQKTPAVAPVKKTTADEDSNQDVQDFLASLTPEQMTRIEALALEAADPLTADGYKRSQESGGPAFLAYQRMVVASYVRNLKKEGISLDAGNIN